MDKRIVKKYHFELISEVKTHANTASQFQQEQLGQYIGTKKALYVIETDTQRRIIKQWVKNHPDLGPADYVELLNSLFRGESVNEISIAGELLAALPRLRKTVEPRYLDAWLNKRARALCMSEVKTEQREATSIKIKPKLWKEAKKQAIDEGKTVSELMEEAIDAYIKEHRKRT